MLKNKIVPHNIVKKSKLCFFLNEEPFVIMRLCIKFFTFIRLTAEIDNLMRLHGGGYPIDAPNEVVSGWGGN